MVILQGRGSSVVRSSAKLAYDVHVACVCYILHMTLGLCTSRSYVRIVHVRIHELQWDVEGFCRE